MPSLRTFGAAALTTLPLALLITACGGGGGGTTAGNAPAVSPAAPAPSSPATASPAPATTVAAGTRTSCNLPGFQADMLAAVNAYRRKGANCGANGSFAAAPDLVWNAALTQAAVVHSDDMVAGNFFSHTGSNGSTVGTRVTAAGYAWRGVGENIAAGQGSVTAVVDGWMKSDGHCANLMNAAYRDIGVACVAGNANTSYRTYWTQDLGTPR